MHIIVNELHDANKDVLLGKRNVNCLSCGPKDAQSTTAGPTSAYQSIHGRDGRVYRGFNPGPVGPGGSSTVD